MFQFKSQGEGIGVINPRQSSAVADFATVRGPIHFHSVTVRDDLDPVFLKGGAIGIKNPPRFKGGHASILEFESHPKIARVVFAKIEAFLAFNRGNLGITKPSAQVQVMYHYRKGNMARAIVGIASLWTMLIATNASDRTRVGKSCLGGAAAALEAQHMSRQ